VFASGVGLCLGRPQLRGERRFERPRRGTDDQGRAARTRNVGTGGRLRRPGQARVAAAASGFVLVGMSSGFEFKGETERASK
jgi:hypothetical protein